MNIDYILKQNQLPVKRKSRTQPSFEWKIKKKSFSRRIKPQLIEMCDGLGFFYYLKLQEELC